MYARLDALLAGTAVALTLALVPAQVALAQSSEAGVKTAVPAPPPAIKNTGPATDQSAAPAADKRAADNSKATAENDGVPLPDLTLPPPLTIKDIGAVPPPEKSQQAAAPASATPAAPQQATAPAAAAPAAPQEATTPATEAPAKAAAAPPPPPNPNAAVTEVLRGLADGKFDRLIGNRKERASIQSFYEKRDYAPLWIDHNALDARGKAAINYLGGVAADGLDPNEYPTPEVQAGAESQRLAEDEIKLDMAVLKFAHNAQTGRVSYTRVSGDISYKLEHDEPAEVLNKLAAADDAAKTLDGFNPQQPGYKALKAALAKARMGVGMGSTERVHVDEGPMLHPGMRDHRVTGLRKRLDVPGDKDNPLYDEAVASAVKEFQHDHGLAADGLLGRATIRTLNAHHHPTANVINTIIANMERWRWMPRHLGNPYVMVNIPDYTLRVVKDGKTVWKTKIVVGKPGKATPLISAEMKYITVNPTWNVPPSIIRNEYLPALREDPNALERIGLKVERNHDGTIHIYQPPGDRNALGRIRFNFPNKFLVYQHDTPDKYLFARDKRAYSHGCMRVQDPLKYAEVLLSLVEPQKGYTEARIHKMFGRGEVNINFPHPIPVHLTYQTAFVDSNGKLELRQDIYGHDEAIVALLHGDKRRVADIPVERRHNGSSQPVMMPAGLMAGGGGGGYRSEPSFFERLFGISPEEPPPPPRHFRRHAGRGYYSDE